ncbi:unnamed protein product [Calypogeia fissa]
MGSGGRRHGIGATSISEENIYNKGRDGAQVDWDFLPEDLLARILSRLPFSSLIRSRCVCKKWNRLNFSSDFTFSGNLGSKCVPIYFFQGPLRVYNSGTNTWEKLSLAFLGVPLNTLALLVSAGGLLCFKDRVSGDFIVCNPITKRWRVLQLPEGFAHEEIRPPMGDIWARTPPVPEFSTIHQHHHHQQQRKRETPRAYKHAMEAYLQAFGRDVIVAMLPQKHDKSFKLLVAGISDGSKRTTLIFDSLTNRWAVSSEVPRGVRFWESEKTLYCNGYLYCITWSHGLPKGVCDLESPWSVVRYNAMDGNWSEYPLSSPGNILPQLVEHRGRGFVVQRRFKHDKVEISFAELKEEDPMTLVMFKHWPLDLFPLDPDEARVYVMGDWCVGQGDCFYLARGHRHYIETQGLPVLAYDLTMDTWTKLPTLRDDFQPSPLWLRTFEASITASV